MSLEQFGYGAGGGIISGILGAVLVALGLRERVLSLEAQKLSKDVFEEYRTGVQGSIKQMDERMERMDKKLDRLLDQNEK